MQFEIVTLFPEMFAAITHHGVVGRAVQRGIIKVHCHNPRDFAPDRHRTVDDQPYGGGPGMVMKVEPLAAAIKAARSAAVGESRVIYLTPQGRRLDQVSVRRQAECGGTLILLAGRYEGADERLIEAEVDEEWSLGDFVLSGGELPAMCLIDAVARLVPGVLGDAESARQDSFEQGRLDHPHYTRPAVVAGRRVPEVLLSGDHRAISRWRLGQSLGRTLERRPDLLAKLTLDDAQRALLHDYATERGLADANRFIGNCPGSSSVMENRSDK